MLAYRVSAGEKRPHLTEVPIPKPGFNDVLVRVAAAGLAIGVLKVVERGMTGCDSDMTVGHHGAGVIDQIGEGVQNLQVGQRVRIHPNLACGTCRFCSTGRDHLCDQGALMGFQGFGKGRMPLFEQYHDGGMASYVVVPSWLVDVLPDNVSFDVGCRIVDLANAVCALRKADLPTGATIAITAATGAMGAACVKVAPLLGIQHIILIGRNAEHLKAVQQLSSVRCDSICTVDVHADNRSLPARVRQLVPRGVDAIIDFLPTGTELYSVLGALAVDGSFIHMGASTEVFPAPMIGVMVNCWKIAGTRSSSRADALCVMDWLGSGALNAEELVSHRFRLADADQAASAMRERSEKMWMVVFNP